MTTENYYPVAIGIDIQNDFMPDGSLPVANGDQIVDPFNQFTESVRKHAGTVAFTRDWHPTTTSHFNAWPAHCVKNTWGGSFHNDLEIKPEDYIFSKGTQVNEDAYSGFQGADSQGITLEQLITERVKQEKKVALYIGGLATDYCVKATVLDALNLQQKIGSEKLAVFVLKNCIKAVDIAEDDGQKAVDEMKQAGAVFLETKELM